MNIYKLVTKNFMLKIELKIYKKDIEEPVNSILNIKVDSDNFTFSTTMDVDVKRFKVFAKDLLRVYNTLNGSALLKETYGDNYIEFKAISNGHIYVKGVMNNISQNGYEQELKFENEFDQTYLKKFVYDINKL